MHEQRELPGGALGDAITTLNQHERRWLRPSTSGHDADPDLKHTTVRWHTGPNDAGDPTGWYILSHENDDEPKIAARTGTVRTDNLDRRLFKLHGANLDHRDLLTPASDQRDDRVNRIIEEGHVQRLHEPPAGGTLRSARASRTTTRRASAYPRRASTGSSASTACASTTPSGAPSRNCEAPPPHSRDGPSRERLQSRRARTSTRDRAHEQSGRNYERRTSNPVTHPRNADHEGLVEDEQRRTSMPMSCRLTLHC